MRQPKLLVDSVFERLGPGNINTGSQSQERSSRGEQMEKCRNWLRTGSCSYGSNCRYQHDPFPSSSRNKSDKDIDEKDLRHKVRSKREETKESTTDLSSPKRRGHKRSSSHNRRSDHDSKIKSTVVVTRPRSPTSESEFREKKRIQEGSWEDDSDDWPVDVSQLDYKEELTLERKRQQLQRELELELQKERMINENVTITKTVSVSGSSSSSSDSDSESSSSESSSSSSGDSDDSSSSSSSSSESSTPVRSKKPTSSRETAGEKYHDSKTNLKSKEREQTVNRSSRLYGSSHTSNLSPDSQNRKRQRDKRDLKSFSPKRTSGNLGEGMTIGKRNDYRSNDDENFNSSLGKSKGPRTPSPSDAHKLKQRATTASSLDNKHIRSRIKRHKRRREDDIPKDDLNYRNVQPPTPPPLSSPNRCAVTPYFQFAKKHKPSSISEKIQPRSNDSSLHSVTNRSHNNRTSFSTREGKRNFMPSPETEKQIDRKVMPRDLMWHESESKKLSDESYGYQKKEYSAFRYDEKKKLPVKKRDSSTHAEPAVKEKVIDSPNYKSEKRIYQRDSNNKPVMEQRRRSLSPVKERENRDWERNRVTEDLQRRKEPRSESLSRNKNVRDSTVPESYGGRKDQSRKDQGRTLSPDTRKFKGNKDTKDISNKSRSTNNGDYWNEEQNKQGYSKSNSRMQDTRASLDTRYHNPLSADRLEKDRDIDRGRKRERDKNRNSGRDDNRTEKLKISSPSRSQSPFHSHSMMRGVDMNVPPPVRNRRYERDPSCGREHEYGYGNKGLNEGGYIEDRYPMRNERGRDNCRNIIYSPEQYRDNRYRGDPSQSIDRYGNYAGKDLHSLNRLDDYIPDLPLDDHLSLDDRWNRGRSMHRDNWDSYGGLVDSSMPIMNNDLQRMPYDLEEDRYSVRSNRHSDWSGGRQEKRERLHSPNNKSKSVGSKEKLSLLGNYNEKGSPYSHNMIPHRQELREKSRLSPSMQTPVDLSPASCGSIDQPNTHISKSLDRSHSNKGKPSLERPRNKLNRRQSREKIKPTTSANVSNNDKNDKTEKSSQSRKRQLTPPIGNDREKRRKLDDNSTKKKKEVLEIKKESSSPSVTNRKTAQSPVETDRPVTKPTENVVKTENVEKKTPLVKEVKEETSKIVDPEFSDWSEGDDDLLTQDIPKEEESKKLENTNEIVIPEKVEPVKQESQPELPPETKKVEEKSSSSSLLSNKEAPVQEEHKQTVTKVTEVIHDEINDIIIEEAVDYDPISDDELDAILGNQDEGDSKPSEAVEKCGIFDALEVNWDSLQNKNKDYVPGNARKRFTTARILSQIGFSQNLLGPEMSKKVLEYCQQQIEKEKNDGGQDNEEEQLTELKMEHPIAAFHVNITANKKERKNVLYNLGPYRQALCARQDLHMRRLLCKPTNKVLDSSNSYHPQNTMDLDLYKSSVELWKQKISCSTQQKIPASI